MGDSKGEDHELCIFDRVDDPVVTYAFAPQVRIAYEGAASNGPRVVAQRIDGLDDSAGCRPVKFRQLLQGFRVVEYAVGPRRAHRPSSRATSSAATGVVRPASRSASRF